MEQEIITTNNTGIKAQEPVATAKKRPGRPPKNPPIEMAGRLGEMGKMETVPLSHIALDDHQFECRLMYSLSDLKESIEKEGQQVPVILRGKEAPYQIVCGFQRIRVLKELGRKTVSAVIRPDLSEEQAILLSYVENEKRRSLHPLDKAHLVQVLRDRGKEPDEIQEALGISFRTYERLEQLLRIDNYLKDMMGRSGLPLKHALLLSAYQRKADISLPEWARRIKEEYLSLHDLQIGLRKDTRGKCKRVKARYLEKKGKGFRLYPMSYNPEKTSGEEIATMATKLKEALSILQSAPRQTKVGKTPSEVATQTPEPNSIRPQV